MPAQYSSLRDPNMFDSLTTAPVLTEQERAAQMPEEGELMKGIRRGVAMGSAGSFAGDALNSELAMDPRYEEQLAAAQRILQHSNEFYAPRVASWRDVNSLGSGADWLAGTAGEMVPGMLPMVGAAALAKAGVKTPLGKVLGKSAMSDAVRKALPNAAAAVPAYNQMRGNIALSQYMDPEQANVDARTRDEAATWGGAANAALGSVVPASLAREGMALQSGSRLLGNIGREAAMQGAMGVGMEGVNQLARQHVNPNAQFDTNAMIDAGVSNMVPGMALTGGMQLPGTAAHMLGERMPSFAGTMPKLAQSRMMKEFGDMESTLAEKRAQNAALPEGQQVPWPDMQDLHNTAYNDFQQRWGVDPADIRASYGTAGSKMKDAARAAGESMQDMYGNAKEAVGGKINDLADDGSTLGKAARTMGTIYDRAAGSDAVDRAKAKVGEGIDAAADIFGRGKTVVDRTLDRMNTAADEATDVGDFIRKSFGDPVDEARSMLNEDDSTVPGETDAEIGANLDKRAASRQQRAQDFAAELMNDPATPEGIKQKLSDPDIDFSDPDTQSFVSRSFVSLRAGQRIHDAVSDMMDLVRNGPSGLKDTGIGGVVKNAAGAVSEAVGKAKDAAVDRIVKRNLQDASPSEHAAFNKEIFDNLTDEARANPEVRSNLDQISNALMAYAARTGDVSKADLPTLTKLSNAMSLFKDPDAAVASITKYAGLPRPEDSFLSRVKQVSSAQNDIKQPNSFLYHSLPVEMRDDMTTSEMRNLARAIDNFTTTDMSKAKGDKTIDAMSKVFGTPENAKAVLDYYRRMNDSVVKFDEGDAFAKQPDDSVFDEHSAMGYDHKRGQGGYQETGEPEAEYTFANAKARRPFSEFKNRQSNGHYISPAAQEAGAMRAGKVGPGANVERVPYGEYVKSTGGDHAAEMARLDRDIQSRIDEHLSHKKEDRSAQINALKDEQTMLRFTNEESGPEAALNNYSVLKTSPERNPLKASDEDMSKYALLTGAKDANNTRITFTKTDGKKVMLSAESMWKTRGDIEGSGGGERGDYRKQRLFRDAVASVLARDDIKGLDTDLRKVVIDRSTGETALKRASPEELKSKAEANSILAKDGVREDVAGFKRIMESTRNVVEAELARAENEHTRDYSTKGMSPEEIARAKSRGAEQGGLWGEARVAEIKDNVQNSLTQFEAKLASLDGVKNSAIPATILRSKIKMLRDLLTDIHGMEFDAKWERSDNNREGVPGMDRMDELNGLRGNDKPGVRGYEEDTGAAVGTGRAPKTGAGGVEPPAAEVNRPVDAPRGKQYGAFIKTRQVGNWVKAAERRIDALEKDPRRNSPSEYIRGLWQADMDAAVASRDRGAEAVANMPEILAKSKEPPAEPAKGRIADTAKPAPAEGVAGDALNQALKAAIRNRDLLAEQPERNSVAKAVRDEWKKSMDEAEKKVAEFAHKLELRTKTEAEKAAAEPEAPKSKVEKIAAAPKKDPAEASRERAEKINDHRALSDAAMEAVANVAVDENFERLNTADKVVSFARMARRAMEQLDRMNPDDMTERQWDLHHALHEMFNRKKDAQFDHKMLFDGLDATSAHKAELDRIFDPNEDISPKKDEPGFSRRSSMENGPAQEWDGNTSKLSADQQKAISEVARIRGKDVKTVFSRLLNYAGDFSMNPDKTERLIRISINAGNPLGVAWHESLHDFISMLGGHPAERDIKKTLFEAASSPQVMAKMRELLAKHPAALEQIGKDMEERAAYMYQFWAQGLLELPKSGQGIMGRLADFFRSMLGVVSNEEKLRNIMESLHSGKFSDPNTVAEVMADLKSQTFNDRAKKILGPVRDLSDGMFKGVTDRLKDTNLDALSDIADMFHRAPNNEQGGLGFLQSRFQQGGKQLYAQEKILHGTTNEQRRKALENLQAMKAPSNALEQGIRDYLDGLYDYMRESDVRVFDPQAKKWNPIGKVADYFPRVWDRAALRADREGFIKLLSQHIDQRQAYDTYNAIVNGDGSLELAENKHSLGFTPWNPAVKDRAFTFINKSNAADFAKYQSKDLSGILNTYAYRAVHRAEYAKFFGNDGEVLSSKLKEAQAQGATDAELLMASKAVQALEGSLGHDFNPRLKEVMSGIMAYENMVLLPLNLFSSLLDPLGVSLRSNDMRDAWDTFKYGTKSLVNAIRRAPDDERTELAKTIGIIDDQTMVYAMGQVYASTNMGRYIHDLNNAFFRYNGMETWNQSMRVAAMGAAERFVVKNVDNKRYMDELGLQKSDVFQMPDGGLAMTKDQLIGAGCSFAKAEEVEKRVQAAVFKWVDDAVLRPSSAHRPIWGSDPRFQLIFHLKQFTYSFQNVFLKRMRHEMANGNNMPAMILAAYVPFQLGINFLKGSVAGGMKDSADLADVFSTALAQSGILGTGIFGYQAAGDVARGQLPGTSFAGPTFGHMSTVMSYLFGNSTAGDVLSRSVPFGNVNTGFME